MVKKGTQVQQGDRDRLIKIINWATVEDPLQIRFELDAAIDEVSNEDHEHKNAEVPCYIRSRSPLHGKGGAQLFDRVQDHAAHEARGQ